MCGYYRLVCSNGLIIADKEFANISIRHINYTFEELTKTVVDILQKLPNQIAVLNDMQNKVLTDEEKTKFAISAIKLRKGYNEEDKVEISQETIDELLSPVRKEDSANNLYNIYNIIQERIIKGNFHYSEKQKKMRKMRMVTSISKDLDINTNLFNLACSNASALIINLLKFVSERKFMHQKIPSLIQKDEMTIPRVTTFFHLCLTT